MIFSKRDRWVAVILGMVFCFSCGKKGMEGEENRVFRLNFHAGLQSLDPAYSSDQAGSWACAQVHAGLVQFDDSLQILPLIARAWEISPDGLLYTFHLRSDVFFHPDPSFGPDSMRKVVAKDFVYSFSRICREDIASPGYFLFQGKVEGTQDFREGKAKGISGFLAPNDSTLMIRLENPFPPFLGQLAMGFASVVPEEAVLAYGKDYGLHGVGAGPFRLFRWREGQSLVLHRNAHYFEMENGVQLPRMDAIHIRFIRSRLSEFVEFCQGRLDFLNGVDKSFKDELFGNDGTVNPQYASKYPMDFLPQLNTEFIAIQADSSLPSMEGHPLRNRKVRQALGWAIDRNKLVQFVQAGNGTPGICGIVPPGLPGSVPNRVHGFGYDPAKASALLAEAGYPGGKGLPIFSLKSNPSYQGLMEFIQKEWERIGVKCEIDNMDGATLRGLAGKGEIQLWRASWIADYPDAENYLSLFLTRNIPPSGPNRVRFSAPAYDALYSAALRETNDSTRFEIYSQMDQLIMDQAVVIPLFYDRILHLSQPNVQGLSSNALNLMYFKRVYKTPSP